MRTVGSVILLISISMLVIVGSIAMSDLAGDAQQSNDSAVVSQASGATSAINPILMIFGYLALIVGAMIAVNAFR